MTDEELEKDFINVCSICLDNNDLVNEFCRLKGLKRPDKRSPIEIQIVMLVDMMLVWIL